MRFALVVTISHPSFKDIQHVDMSEANSLSSYLRTMKLPNKVICDLRNNGEAKYIDKNGVTHHLEVETEAN